MDVEQRKYGNLAKHCDSIADQHIDAAFEQTVKATLHQITPPSLAGKCAHNRIVGSRVTAVWMGVRIRNSVAAILVSRHRD